MMLGVVASDGKRMPPFWFPQGLRVGAKEYLAVIKNVVKPWLDATYPRATTAINKMVHLDTKPRNPRSGARTTS
ncbi:Uncharacterized protein FKW44_017497 [Caligus rogercresseyi]|uniref:Uncharacterized protein n=1 Tax=Caligus rogercresseyi TaxID=217165 RepID=A0A7T8GT31_CALRO|nr:Uncharacterized protein FKW44_017497 [Caligus rogercresseyi]